MAKGATISLLPCKHPRYKYVVVVSRGGKRLKQHFVKSKAQGETLVGELEAQNANLGAEAATSVTSQDNVVIHQAKLALAEYGKTFKDALDHYLAYLRQTEKKVPLDTLVDELLDLKEKEKRAARYITQLRLALRKFARDHKGQMVGEIDTAAINRWLVGLGQGPVSMMNHRRVLGVAFAYGLTSGYCAKNPVEAAMIPKVEESAVGILSPSEAKKLLEVAHSEIRPIIAIGLFAGVRDAELKRLDWNDIDLEGSHIEIRALKAKSARRRLIKIQPNLAAWLKPCKDKTGSIWPAQGQRGRNLLEAARRDSGFGEPEALAEKEKQDGEQMKPWPHNAMRHSFASYHLAHFKNAAELALELGHTNAQLIFQHYREVVKPKDAEEFWKIGPEGWTPPAPTKKATKKP